MSAVPLRRCMTEKVQPLSLRKVQKTTFSLHCQLKTVKLPNLLCDSNRMTNTPTFWLMQIEASGGRCVIRRGCPSCCVFQNNVQDLDGAVHGSRLSKSHEPATHSTCNACLGHLYCTHPLTLSGFKK